MTRRAGLADKKSGMKMAVHDLRGSRLQYILAPGRRV